MGTVPSAEIPLQREIERLRARLAELEHSLALSDTVRQGVADEASPAGGPHVLASFAPHHDEALRDGEELFRTLANAIPQLCWMANADGWIFWYNERWYRYTGTIPEQMEGWGWQSVHHPDTLPKVLERWQASIASGEPFDMIFPLRGADGVFRPFLTRVMPVRDRDGRVARWFGTNTDISEQLRVQEALRESESRLRTLSDNLPDGLIYRYRIDTKGQAHVDFISAGIERITGVPAAEYMSNAATVERYILPEDRTVLHHAIAGSREQLTRFDIELRHIHRETGEIRWALLRSTPTRSPDGSTVWDGIELDISERKVAEEALREYRAKLQAALASMADAVFISDIDGRFVEFNDAFATFHRFKGKEECAKTLAEYPQILDVLLPDGTPAPLEKWAVTRALRGEVVANAEYDLRRKDTGETWTGSFSFGPIHDKDGAIGGAVVVARDITYRKQADKALRASEAALRESEARYRRLVDLAPEAILVQQHGQIVYCNEVAAQLYGAESPEKLLGSSMFQRVHQDDLPAVMERIREGECGIRLPVREARHLRLDGSEVAVETTAGPVEWHGQSAMLVFVRDITNRKRSEARLRDAQKLESLGLLAGGVAHDFNNLLVGVVGNASLAQDMLPPNHPVGELLEGILKTGEQAAHLTRQMLAYSGKGKFMVEPLDLSAVIPGMSGLVRPSISKKIALRLDLGSDLPLIEADRGQVQQVFMNLALNASEAIGSHEGEIHVKTGVQEVDETYMRLHPETAALKPGKYVFLEVRDTGCGMDEATRAKIFDPFYSTKFTGRGLGLAAVSGIIRGHMGAITVSSEPGQGSRFTVLFRAAEHITNPLAEAVVPSRVHGSGTVLVVDDEQIVRGMAKKALERHGYTVLLADSGLAAIDVLKRHPGEIALVLLDLSMPGMSGEEALPELRKIRPDVKVMVTSGYSESVAMTPFKGQRVSGFIQKPYTAKRLAELVETCLK